MKKAKEERSNNGRSIDNLAESTRLADVEPKAGVGRVQGVAIEGSGCMREESRRVQVAQERDRHTDDGGSREAGGCQEEDQDQCQRPTREQRRASASTGERIHAVFGA